MTALEHIPELFKFIEHKLQDCQKQIIICAKESVDTSMVMCDLKKSLRSGSGDNMDQRKGQQCGIRLFDKIVPSSKMNCWHDCVHRAEMWMPSETALYTASVQINYCGFHICIVTK